ncbi:MAG: enoyl-CoA hydratase-related protein [bacterium]|nr:enoyl-CoA hydratase-related protein [bacterium]
MSVPLRVERDGAVVHVWLSCPEVRNAFNAELIGELNAHLAALTSDPPRVLVLGGDGPLFCSGADAKWMADSGQQGWDANYADALEMANLLATLNALPCAVLGRVQGGAYGGGIGLLACCDAVVAVDNAAFSFGEVRLGIAPATIAPYVVAKIGVSAARELFLSAAKFDAYGAKAIGLVHAIVAESELDSEIERRIEQYLANGPGAVAATKRLLAGLHSVSQVLLEETARLISELRTSPEGRDGLAAFIGKRKARWVP